MARDQTEGSRIGDIRRNDGNGGCRLPHRDCELGVARDHNVGLEPHQLVSKRRPARHVAIGIAPDDLHIAAGGIAELQHALRKGPLIV